MKKAANILNMIMLGIGLLLAIMVDLMVIFLIPPSIEKNLAIFYFTGTIILVLLQFVTTEIEIDNELKAQKQKNYIRFSDNSWRSYVYYCIIMAPVLFMAISMWALEILNRTPDVKCLLQAVYWVIAIANFIWFLWHIRNAKTKRAGKKVNTYLKLAVCVVSGLGFMADFIAKLGVKKQLAFIAWTVLLLSFISDIKKEE